jgi:hypothetical protein
MKKLFTGVLLSLTMSFASIANAGLIKDLDLNTVTTGQITIKSAVSSIDQNRIFSFLIPIFTQDGSGDLVDWIDVIGYSISNQGSSQVISTLYDFSSAVTLLSGWELSLNALTGTTIGNVTDITGTAVLSNQTGFVNFAISGMHTAFYDTQRFTNASFEGLLTVTNSGGNTGPIDVPEPSTLAIFAIAMCGLVKRKKLV